MLQIPPLGTPLSLETRLSGAAGPWRNWISAILLAVAVGIAYFLAAKLSLALLSPHGVAEFWPAAGVATGALLALGSSRRLPVVAGTMGATLVANLLGDRTLWSAIIFALCNAGEALLTAGLIEHYFGTNFTLDRLRSVLGFIVMAMVGAGVSGIGGALGFVWFHDPTASTFLAWQEWFLSDGLGIVTVAPLVIGLASTARERPSHGETVEGLTALAGLTLMSIVVISLPPEPWKTVVPIALLFPLLLWIAARCPPVFAAAAAFIVTIAIVWTTTFGIGHFGDPGLPMPDRVLAARAGVLVVALCAYVLSALFSERRQHEAALSESEARLQEALTAGAVAAFVWDLRTGSSQRSANAAQILGLEPEQSLTGNGFLTRVHIGDRERFKAAVRGVNSENPTYTTTFRFKRPDGRDVWLEEMAKAEFDAAGRLLRVQGLTLDVTERKRSEERQRMLISELDHRVKNLLARVAVVVMYTRQGSNASLEEYIQALDRRIQSMADAHSLLSQNRWQGVDLGELIRHQLAPYATEANTAMDGPEVTLTVAVTQALAMVLHELVTNAVKYGALSTQHGRVEVKWTREPDGGAPNLSIAWREIGGPAITSLPASGYGLSLIRDLVPHELGGSVDFAFERDGVYCTMGIPLAVARAEHKDEPFPELPTVTSLDARLRQAAWH
jgi:PAS domain S-box-containing protein